MIALWLACFLVTKSVAYTDCESTSAALCPREKECRVTCEDKCSVISRSRNVSVCGWLQSLGYDTSDLLVTSYKNTVKITALTSNTDNNYSDKRTISTFLETRTYPYTQFAFIHHPKSQKVEKGSVVTFKCKAVANYSILYQWFEAPYSFLPVLIKGETSSQYIIKNVSSRKNGFYICQVTETLTEDVYWSAPAQLEVLYISEAGMVHTTTQDVQSGLRQQTIPCTLPDSYPPATARWYKYTDIENRVEVTGRSDMFYNQYTGDLYLINTNKDSHSGVYECTASNAYLNVVKYVTQVTITVSGNQATPLLSPLTAYFDSTAPDNVVVGEPLTLRCAAHGNPSPEIYWTFGDDKHTLCKIPSSRYTSTDKGRYVVLDRVKEQDLDYTYQCKGENTVFTRTLGSLTSVGSYKKLAITQDTLRYTVQYMTNLTLSCAVSGVSTLKNWYKDGTPLTFPGAYYTLDAAANAIELQVSTHTHGVYTCLTMNKIALVLKNLHVTLPVLAVTVRISRRTQDKYITCVASGFPPPRVYWFENNIPVTDSTRYSIMFDVQNATIINSTLNISTMSAQTEFKCLAISQTEEFSSSKFETYVWESTNTNRQDNKIVYIVVGGALFVVGILIVIVITLVVKFKTERRKAKPIRTYMRNIQDIQMEEGTEITSKAQLRDEFKYAAQLHDILKTFEIKDEGDLESFRDVVGEWLTEETGDSDFARRFRESFMSKRSYVNTGRLTTSNRYGKNFRLDLQAAESRLLDDTPERAEHISLDKAPLRNSHV